MRCRKITFVALAALLAAVNPILSLDACATEAVSGDASNAGSICSRLLTEFLRAPTEGLLKSLNETAGDGCWSTAEMSNERLQSLLTQVTDGSTPAAKYLVRHVLGQLDGGNLEDSFVALGNFSDQHMEALLDLAAEGGVSRAELKRALTMLPPELSDEPSAQLRKMKARRGAVERVGRKALSSYRSEALGAIDGFIAEIERSAGTGTPNKHSR